MRPPPDNAFVRCDACEGLGFLSHGMLPDRTYRKCAACNGIGQRYTAPVPEKPPAKPKPAPDPMVF